MPLSEQSSLEDSLARILVRPLPRRQLPQRLRRLRCILLQCPRPVRLRLPWGGPAGYCRTSSGSRGDDPDSDENSKGASPGDDSSGDDSPGNR